MGVDSTAKLLIGFEVSHAAVAAIFPEAADHSNFDLGNGWHVTYAYPYNDCNSDDIRFYIHYKLTNKQRPYYQNEQLASHQFASAIFDARQQFPALVTRCQELNIDLQKSPADLMVMAVAHVS